MERAAAGERVGGRPFEMGVLWSAIGVAMALLLLAVLGKAGVLSIRAVQICGTILIWLCATVMLMAVWSGMRYLAKK